MEEKEQKVALLEECRSSVLQEAASLRSSMRELEKSRLQARRQLQELRRQVTAFHLLPFMSRTALSMMRDVLSR